MTTCNLGIKHTVEKYTEKKGYLRFDGNNFIQILTSFTKKVFPENYFSVAESVSKILNKRINSDINIGKIFYNGTKDNKRGVVIEPTTKQLNLLNAKDAGEREIAIKEWESEEHQRELEERMKEIEGEEEYLGIPSMEEIKVGVDFVFEQNTELGEIGNQEEYSKYLDIIFPNSKVKEVVYHGSNIKFEGFLEDNLNYFGTKEIAKGYGSNLYSAVIEIKKPYYEDGGNLSNQSHEDLYTKLDELNSDGFISNSNNLFVPKNESQIHILGSTEDIKGFKKFIEDNNKINIQNEGNEGSINKEITGIPEARSRSGLFLEGVDIPNSFTILQKETINSSPKRLSTRLDVRHGAGGVLLDPFYQRVMGRTFSSIQQLASSDMVGGDKLEYLYLRVAQSLYGNQFNSRLAEKLKLDRIAVIDDASRAPMFAYDGLLHININSKYGLIEDILRIEDGNRESNYLDTVISEELIHLVSAKVASREELDKAYEELSEADKIRIYKSYFNTNEVVLSRLPKRNYVHEYIRMKIQEKLLHGYTTEKERKGINAIINQVWEFIEDLIPYYKHVSFVYNKTLRFIETGEGDIDNTGEELLGLPILNQPLNDFFDVVKKYSDKLEVVEEKDDVKRHYLYEGQKVARSVTEKVKAKSTMPDRTDKEKIVDEQKRVWGTEGHSFIEKYIVTNLIDENGYVRKEPLKIPIDTELSELQQTIIKGYIKKLTSSYPEGTRFTVETKGVNTAEKGMLGATMDFLAFVPIKKDGRDDFYVEILDWKFTDLNKDRNTDIPWQKQTEWKAQMGEYSKIMYKYGLKPNQLRKARMIPFIMNYEYSIPGNKNSALQPKNIEIGDPNNLSKSELYLLPVPTDVESTGNTNVDKFIKALSAHYDKLLDRRVDKSEKSPELNQIEKAIRMLHVQMNFEPLYGVAKTFMTNAKKHLEEYKSINYSSLTEEEINAKVAPLIIYKESALKFMDLDVLYASTINKEALTTTEKKLLSEFEDVATATKRMILEIENYQRAFAIEYALKHKITSEEIKKTITQSEVAIDNISKTFLVSSKLSPKIVKLMVLAWQKAKGIVDTKVNKKINELSNVLLPLYNEAKSQGKSPFKLIGEIRGGTLKLIRKIDNNFYKEIKKAKDKRNRKFIIENINLDVYKQFSDKKIEEETKLIESSFYFVDEEKNQKEKELQVSYMKRRYDVTREDFNGFKNKTVGYYINQSLKLDEHISKEYAAMSDAAKAVWQFFTKLNEKADALGYINKQGKSFIPLIEGTILEKLGQTGNAFTEMWDIFKGGSTVKVNEEATYGKKDAETGEVKRSAVKYFTQTDKKVEQLSKDLSRIGPLYIKALYEFENKQKMESTLQTLQAVEDSKHNLIVTNGQVELVAGEPQEAGGENKNALVLKAIMESYLYDIMEDVSSFGNVAIGTVANKLIGDEENINKNVISTKKIMNNADTLIKVLGVGAKPVLGITNWMGQQLHAAIKSGERYSFGEYELNNIKISSNLGMSLIEKALLHKFIPLNEDVAEEASRRLAKKQSLMQYLSRWTFTDVIMTTMSIPERKLQFANAMSFLDNTMVADGKLVNIRQYLHQQDAKEKFKINKNGKYILSEAERREFKKTFENRVEELKKSSALKVVSILTDEDVVIPGASEEAISECRLHIKEYNRKLNGQMTPEDMAAYRKDTILRSFMMFKTWIPPMLSERALDMQKNEITGDWEYGRTRVFIKTWVQACNWNIFRMQEIIKGSDEGLRMLDEMLERKRNEHFKKTGFQLEISREEFHQMIQEQLVAEAKELGLLLSTMGLVLLAGATKPPEDATDYEKNRYKWWARLINKVSDELAFYYNPTSFMSATKGNILPSLGLLGKITAFTGALEKETRGYILDDEKMMKEAYPTKYFLNMIPGLAQIQSDYLPYIIPEWSKSMGVRVSTQSRRQ